MASGQYLAERLDDDLAIHAGVPVGVGGGPVPGVPQAVELGHHQAAGEAVAVLGGMRAGQHQAALVTQSLQAGQVRRARGQALLEGAGNVGGDDGVQHGYSLPWGCRWRARKIGRATWTESSVEGIRAVESSFIM